MGIANSFEKKIFFNWGRHLWNFIGVSGFFAFLSGIILFLNSTFIEFPKSKQEYFGEDYITQEMIPIDLFDWIKSDSKDKPFLNPTAWARENNKVQPISKDGKKVLNYPSWQEYIKYRQIKFNEYLIAKFPDIGDMTLGKYRQELIEKQNIQNDIYKTYKVEMQNRNDIKYGQRIVSPFVIGYGLAVVASSSLSSALLSIERNTRKKED
tara:strand:+ start:278 stop:904 length:627 start_codon:yes stop_codon:yes gene_type:complete